MITDKCQVVLHRVLPVNSGAGLPLCKEFVTFAL